MKHLYWLPAALVCAGTATAQISDEELRENTIIVTTPGAERTAGELISNVTAVGRDELVADLQGTLGDTLDKQPGVATTFFGAGSSRPVLRGLGAERVLVLTNGLGVIDASAASPDHQSGTDGIDAERVEILRGPAALAYGGQAIGGVVNVIDGLIVEDLPEEAVSGQLYSAYNSVNDGSELAGRSQFTFGDFVLTVSASQRDFDDYDIPGFAESEAFHEAEGHEDEEDHEEEEEIRDTLTNSFLSTNTYSAGLSYIFENGYLGLAVRRQESQYGLPGHSHDHEHEEVETDEDHEEEGEENAFIDLEQTRIDLQAGLRFQDGFVRAIDARFSASDYEHAEFEAPGEIGTQYFSEGYEGRVELDHVLGEVFGTAGLQFSSTEFRAVGEEAFITPTDSEELSLFVYETREWDNGFGVEGGARLENVSRDNEVYGERSFDLLSGSIGVHQHWENGFFMGAQISLTERAPNQSELFADGAHLATDQYEVGNPDFDAEQGLNYEGTVRWQDDNLSLGLNLFHTEFDGFIFLTPGVTLHDGALVDEIDEVPVYLFAQEDADFNGGEIYGSYHLEDGPLGAHWDVKASLDFVNAELASGDNVPYLPPVTINTDISADWGAFDAGIGLVHASAQNQTGEGLLDTDGYTTVDLTAGYDLAGCIPNLDTARIFLQARNLTDEEVRYSTSVLKDTLPAPGQNIRVGFSAEF